MRCNTTFSCEGKLRDYVMDSGSISWLLLGRWLTSGGFLLFSLARNLWFLVFIGRHLLFSIFSCCTEAWKGLRDDGARLLWASIPCVRSLVNRCTLEPLRIGRCATFVISRRQSLHIRYQVFALLTWRSFSICFVITSQIVSVPRWIHRLCFWLRHSSKLRFWYLWSFVDTAWWITCCTTIVNEIQRIWR